MSDGRAEGKDTRFYTVGHQEPYETVPASTPIQSCTVDAVEVSVLQDPMSPSD